MSKDVKEHKHVKTKKKQANSNKESFAYKNGYVAKDESQLKLTPEEVEGVSGFEQLSSEKRDELIDFIYSLSLILYKTFEDEES